MAREIPGLSSGRDEDFTGSRGMAWTYGKERRISVLLVLKRKKELRKEKEEYKIG